jgi:citrate lyase subunit beta/citryl-CoA lyase
MRTCDNISIELLRSLLFVPGNQPDVIDKAMKTKADVVIMDLEDAVHIDEKSKARLYVKEKIALYSHRSKMVRVNALETMLMEKDISAILDPNLSGLMIPKVESSDGVKAVENVLCRLEAERHLVIGQTNLVLLIETALGVENAFRIAATNLSKNRKMSIAFGAADFAFDMGMQLSKEGSELAFPRARIAIACRAAGLDGPIDTPFMTDLTNMHALENDATRARSFGYRGKLCIHPKQVDICNRLFSPSAEEIRFAERVVAAYEKTGKKGQGAFQLDGKMVDYPILKQSERILNVAKKIGLYH